MKGERNNTFTLTVMIREKKKSQRLEGKRITGVNYPGKRNDSNWPLSGVGSRKETEMNKLCLSRETSAFRLKVFVGLRAKHLHSR